MSGASLSVTFQSGRVQKALTALQNSGRNPQGLLGSIATGLLRNTMDRFDAEVSPNGSAWAPLNAWYLTFKRGPGILRGAAMNGGLQDSLTSEVQGSSVVIGSNKPYAAVHQFGATIRPKNPSGMLVIRSGEGGKGPVMGKARSVTIPARPYLGLSARDEETILDAAETHLDLILRRA